MKRILAIFLAALMLLSLAACKPSTPTVPNADPTDPTDPIVETPDPTEPVPTLPDVTVENPVTYLTIGYGDADGNYYTLTAYDNDEGMVYVEYMGEVKKVGTFELSVLHNLTQALEESGFAALNGQSEYNDGAAYASMYVSYQDDTMLSADYSGQIPDAFMTCYNKLDAFFQVLTAGLEVYVPQPVVMDDVNPDVLAAMNAILNNTGMENLDSLYISSVPMDEFFGITLGLTETEGVLSGTNCAPMMLATAYSFVIVQVSEDADKDAICQDFADHLEWNKWVCVSASNAMIARNGDMILCLMASGDLYDMTANAIEAAGWTDIETYENPNM